MKEINSIGIIGYGAFGSFTHTLLTAFASHVQVRVYSIDRKIDNKTFVSVEEVCKSDAVILAVPIGVYEEVIQQIVPLLGPQTVIVDVATVKELTIAALRKHASGVRYVSTHPMFGSQSYEKKNRSINGFRFVVCEHTLNEKDYTSIRNFFASLGLVVVELGAGTHDKLLAETLFLTHYVAQTILDAGFSRTNIDTVSFRFLKE